MDTQPPSSFIPKKPLTGVSKRGGTAMGTFIFLISLLVFIASLVSAASAFAYQGYLKTTIAQKSDTLQKAEAAFDPATIKDLERLDSRINNAEALLQKHITTLAIFNFLATQTLQNVQFSSFSYELDSDNTATITLGGVADGFSTVALQSDQFGASKVLKDVVFSGIVVDPSGKVAFNVKATLDPSLLDYAKNLSIGSDVINNVGTTTTSSTTAGQPETPTVAPTLPNTP